MVKNNIIALFTHILCSIIFIIIAMPYQDNFFIVGIIALLLLMLYVFVGTKLKFKESKLKTILSVSSTGFLGIMLYGLGLVSKVSIGIFIIYLENISSIMFFIPSKISQHLMRNHVAQLIFCFIPTFLIWIGIEWKRKKVKPEKNQPKTE